MVKLGALETMFKNRDDDHMDEDTDRRVLEARDWNMDIDQPQDGIATLRPYVAVEEGPSRKRKISFQTLHTAYGQTIRSLLHDLSVVW